jgi:hypothetical protein
MMFSYLCVSRVVEGDGVMEAGAGWSSWCLCADFAWCTCGGAVSASGYGAGGFGIKW